MPDLDLLVLGDANPVPTSHPAHAFGRVEEFAEAARLAMRDEVVSS